jgi:Ribosomal protein S7p/S5e
MMHRKGSKTVAHPIALGEKRRTHFAVHWLLKACEKRTEARPEKTIEERLARELIAVIQGKSGLLKNKKDMHVFAMVNRCGICEDIGFLYLTNTSLVVGTHGIVYESFRCFDRIMCGCAASDYGCLDCAGAFTFEL